MQIAILNEGGFEKSTQNTFSELSDIPLVHKWGSFIESQINRFYVLIRNYAVLVFAKIGITCKDVCVIGITPCVLSV